MNAERQKVPGGELYDLMDAELEWQPPVRPLRKRRPKEYDSMQIDAHKDAVDLFDRYAKRGDNKDLKSFAAKQLGSKRFGGSHKPTVHLCTERTPESVVARCMEHASINHQFIVTERVGPTPVNRVT